MKDKDYKNIEYVKEFLNNLGIEYTEHKYDGEWSNNIEIKVDGGYSGFYTLFEFTKEGKFIKMGAYE